MRERVAALFLSRPHEWIDGREIQLVGGQYAWRTRVSDCRTQLHMVIDNRQRKERGVTVSEYRYVPSDDEFCLTREADGPTRRQG